MSASPLTQRQIDILEAIRRGVRERGFPPSIREIGSQVGLASSSTVHRHLCTLEELGYIRRDPSRPRCIEVTGDPLAGLGEPDPIGPSDERVGLIPVLENLNALDEGREPLRVPLPRDLTGDNAFLFQVEGDSMRDAGILHGDLVIANRRDDADDGDIVVAIVNQDITVKRYFQGTGVVRLESDNRRMKPIYVRDARIIGKVVGLIRRLY